MAECSVCGDTVYLGSRLAEDSYVDDGKGGYKHVICPRPPDFTPTYRKGIADGRCGHCGHKVPDHSLNKFYCSDSCRARAWEVNHPDEDSED